MSDTPPDLTPEQVSPEPAPKKRIIQQNQVCGGSSGKAPDCCGSARDGTGFFPGARKRTIRKKVAELADDGMESVDVPGKKDFP